MDEGKEKGKWKGSGGKDGKGKSVSASVSSPGCAIKPVIVTVIVMWVLFTWR